MENSSINNPTFKNELKMSIYDEIAEQTGSLEKNRTQAVSECIGKIHLSKMIIDEIETYKKQELSNDKLDQKKYSNRDKEIIIEALDSIINIVKKHNREADYNQILYKGQEMSFKKMGTILFKKYEEQENRIKEKVKAIKLQKELEEKGDLEGLSKIRKVKGMRPVGIKQLRKKKSETEESKKETKPKKAATKAKKETKTDANK
jgi:hypothetical protein